MKKSPLRKDNLMWRVMKMLKAITRGQPRNQRNKQKNPQVYRFHSLIVPKKQQE